MKPPTSPRFLEAVERVSKVLPPNAGMFIGGVAVIAHGAARTTLDVDATILGSAMAPADVVRAWAAHGIEPRIADAAGFAAESQVLLLRDVAHDVAVDLTFAWLPFEERAIARAVELPFGSSRLRVPRVEDLIVYKLVASRPRDLEDVERLVAIHADIDVTDAKTSLREFAEALERPELIETFERLVERA